jgi:hypothetical protein
MLKRKYILSGIWGREYRRGMYLILDLLTPLRTTSNYSAIADLHTSQITKATAKFFQLYVSSPVVPW